MSLSIRVEDLARAVVCLDTTDLPALVRLQDELTDLAASIEGPEHLTLASACRHAADAVESIVLRSAEDADATLAQIRQAIEYAQEVADAAAAGSDPASVQPPSFLGGRSAPQAADIDMELLSAWVSSCSSALNELESAAVSIDAGEEDTGQEAESRRIIHTIKGEAGILSLGTIQAVCHDCETLIDLAKEHGGKFPAEPVLAIIDWVRACIAVLSADPTAPLPAHADLHESIRASIRRYDQEAPAGGSPAAAPTAPTPSPAAPIGERQGGAPGADRPAEGAGAAPPARADRPAGQDQPTPATQAAPPATPVFEGADGPVEFPPEAVIDETCAEFVCEAREHIANAEQSLLDLEADLANLELINTVFRAFHTIKGVSGFMHLTPMVRLTHVAETLLDQARSGKLGLTPGHLDLFLRSCDVLGQLIGALQGGTPPMRSLYEALMHQLDYACKTGQAPAPQGVGHTKPAPAPAPSAPAPSAPAPSAPAPSAQAPSAPAPSAQAPSAQAPSAQAPVGPPPGAPALDADDTDEAEAPEPGAPAPPARSTAEAKPARAPAKSAAKIEQTVKVNTTRMDALVDMVGELVIGYQMVYQDDAIQGIKQQHTQRTLGHVSKIIRDLQEVAMSLRLVTLRSTFQKMARLVRDVSAKAGKNIRFHVEGEDVELDRNVVEEIADPLVHMIRNACDHGIEPAAERVHAGKTPEGNLYLRAYHQGGSIVVEVTDDGKGLRRDKIIEKAVAKGLIPADRDPAEVQDQDIYNLIFAPGFSTADKVTDISGRGVGMDVVRRNIEALRGKVEISSKPGEGSTFKMRLPLTMAIIDGMVVRVGSQRYVIPTLAIEQSFRPQPRDIHTVVGRGEMVKVRGNLLPVHRAKSIFGLRDGADSIQDGLLVVLEAHNARFCLLVDEIVGQQQVVIKTLGHGLAPIRGVSGGAILGDGRVALILDIGGLIQEATKAA
ncbi:MAG: Hpt domain-containing protein [Phycisphaerales bacterium]|nr:Hpt domain-containing protein [Phycisphaerales bacterium]